MTGYFYSVLNQKHVPFESLLERDYFLSLEFDPDIMSYDSQPVEIVKRENKYLRKYYPDCLIQHTACSGKPSLLVEVKHSKDLENPKKADDIRQRISISEDYAAEQGWGFKLITDKDICGTLLENHRFLYKYSDPPAALSSYRMMICNMLRANSQASAADIADALASTFLERAAILPCIWHLLRSRAIATDLQIPLTNLSLLEASDV